MSTAKPGRLLVKVSTAAEILDVDATTVYDLAARGILEKRYIGSGTRNFRLTYASIEKYVNSLPADPVIRDDAAS